MSPFHSLQYFSTLHSFFNLTFPYSSRHVSTFPIGCISTSSLPSKAKISRTITPTKLFRCGRERLSVAITMRSLPFPLPPHLPSCSLFISFANRSLNLYHISFFSRQNKSKSSAYFLIQLFLLFLILSSGPHCIFFSITFSPQTL